MSGLNFESFEGRTAFIVESGIRAQGSAVIGAFDVCGVCKFVRDDC